MLKSDRIKYMKDFGNKVLEATGQNIFRGAKGKELTEKSSPEAIFSQLQRISDKLNREYEQIKDFDEIPSEVKEEIKGRRDANIEQRKNIKNQRPEPRKSNLAPSKTNF